MLKHIVLLKLKDILESSEVEQLFAEIAKIKNQLPGVMSFNYGKAIGTEASHQGYTHAYSMDFADPAYFQSYLAHESQSTLQRLLKDALASEDGMLIFNHDLHYAFS